jgi:hypothetical protein
MMAPTSGKGLDKFQGQSEEHTVYCQDTKQLHILLRMSNISKAKARERIDREHGKNTESHPYTVYKAALFVLCTRLLCQLRELVT